MGQDRKVSKLAAKFVRINIAGLWPSSVYNAIIAYLQCQEIMGAEAYVNFIAMFFNGFMTWFLVIYMGWGFTGAPWSAVVTSWFSLIFLLIICYFTGYHKQTWFVWSKKAWTRWGEFLKIAIPGMFMLCAEWWLFEVWIIISGLFGKVNLAAYSVTWELSMLNFMVPLGVGIAVSTRTSNLLGANNPAQAKIASMMAVIFGTLWVLVNIGACLLFRREIAGLFSTDDDVIDQVAGLMPVLALSLLFDGLQGFFSGILRGTGRQTVGSVLNLIGYYVIALPVGLYLAFQQHLQVYGLWWGLVIGLAAVSLGFGFFVLRIDWTEEARLAQIRAAEENSPEPVTKESEIDSDEEDEVLSSLVADMDQAERQKKRRRGSKTKSNPTSPFLHPINQNGSQKESNGVQEKSSRKRDDGDVIPTSYERLKSDLFEV